MEIPYKFIREEFPIFGKDVVIPVDTEPAITTMDKKLIINVAPAGALMAKSQNSTLPGSAEEIAQEVIEAYREGASMFHVHCREDDRSVFDNPELYKKTIDLVHKEAPDMIIDICTVSSLTVEGAEGRMKPMLDPLLDFGHEYAELTVINPVPFTIGGILHAVTAEGMEEEAKYAQEQGVKPALAVYNLDALDLMKKRLIEKKIIEKPYLFIISLGIHNTTPAIPDMEGYMSLFQLLRLLPSDSIWSAIHGGRNWLPLSVISIMMGCDVVRVGKEDTVHIYPHKDEVITSCADMVRKIASIAKELGREIATPAEARKILGIRDNR